MSEHETPRWMEIQEGRRMEKEYQRAARKAARKAIRDENARIRRELRDMGWDAGVVYVRAQRDGSFAFDYAATGGLTMGVAERRIVTEAVCHERDHFDKLIGSNLALKRLREAVFSGETPR